MKRLFSVLAILATSDAHAQSTGDMSPSVLACDQVAFNGSNSDNPNGVTSLDFSDLNPSEALPKCQAAHDEFPGHLRTIYHLGRVYHAGRDEDNAVRYLTLSAQRGYILAFNNLTSLVDGSDTSFRDDPAILTVYQKMACDQGKAWFCQELGSDDPSYFAIAITRYEASCDQGDGSECRKAGHLLNDTDKPTHDDALSLSFFERGCELEDANACANIGWMHLWRDVPGKSATVAIDRLSAACSSDPNQVWACESLGDGYKGDYFGTPDFASSAEWYEMGCDQRHATSCRKAGHLLKDTDKPIHDDALSLTFFERGCEFGDANACANIGWMHLWRDVPGKSSTVAIDRLSTACLSEAGFGGSCSNLGDAYEGDELGDPDYATSMEWYEIGCNQGSAVSCRGAGHLLNDTDKPTHDDALSLSFFERGCELEDANACANIGWMHLNRDVPGKSVSVAIDRLSAACSFDVGEAWACRSLGVGYEDGDFGAVDFDKAGFWFNEGCTQDDGGSCGYYGDLLEDGDLGVSDPSGAAIFFELGCELDSGWSCGRLADLHQDGDLGTANLEVAKNLFEKGCGLDHAWSCGNLGNILISERATYATGRGFLGKGCNLNDSYSCRSLGHYYEHSDFGPRNLERAASFYEIACQQDNEWACSDLGYANQKLGETAAAAIAHLKACELGDTGSCATYGISVFEAGNIQRGIDFSIRSLEEGNNHLITNMDNRNAQSGSRMYLTSPQYDGLRKGIQRQLRSRGLYNGSIDGIFGPNMESAMRALCDC